MVASQKNTQLLLFDPVEMETIESFVEMMGKLRNKKRQAPYKLLIVRIFGGGKKGGLAATRTHRVLRID